MACNTCGRSSCECKLGAYACPKLSNATHPVFRVTMVKYDHASQSSSVSNSNNDCQLTSVKRAITKHIG